ncbi:hypothetical protein [Mariprofundus sp. NF]|nr:hypothetical protein [Mariprofundus sp. NF]
MRLMIALIVSLFLLSSCATMESAWDSTVTATGDAYDWVVGNDEEETK